MKTRQDELKLQHEFSSAVRRKESSVSPRAKVVSLGLSQRLKKSASIEDLGCKAHNVIGEGWSFRQKS